MKDWDGTFELVDPTIIGFDRTRYQREEQWRSIAAIAANPRWPSFVVVPCAKREYAGGTLWAYDAQQRLLGVLSTPNPPKLVPVVWWAVRTRNEEAEIFLDVNVNRTNVSSIAKFKAQVGAANPTYLRIATVLEDCGFSLAANADSARAIGSTSGLLEIYNETAEAGLRVALQAVAASWPDETQATSVRMLILYATVLSEMASNGGIEPDKFAAALARTTPAALTRKAKDLQHETGCSLRVAMRRSFKVLAKI
jgi:hypothetical protein